jgi:hypothetical protein
MLQSYVSVGHTDFWKEQWHVASVRGSKGGEMQTEIVFSFSSKYLPLQYNEAGF